MLLTLKTERFIKRYMITEKNMITKKDMTKKDVTMKDATMKDATMKDMRIKDMTIKEYVIMKKDMVMEKKPITGGRYMKDFKDEKLYLIHLIFQAMNKR